MRRDPTNELSSDQYRDELRALRWDWSVFGGLFFFFGVSAPVLLNLLSRDEIGNLTFILPFVFLLLHYLCRLFDENRLSWRVRIEQKK